MSEIVALIPARSGSKSLKNKNIKLLMGIPLIAYSIRVALLTEGVDRVIVSTDSEEYASIAMSYGAEVPFLRPLDISGDNSSDYECMKHFLDWNVSRGRDAPEYIVHLRPTTPIREAYRIEKALDIMRRSRGATSLRSVREMSESAYKTVEIENGILKGVGSGSKNLDLINMNRQQFSKTYYTNGYVDILRSDYIIKNKKIHGDHVVPYFSPFSIDLDTKEDFNYLEYYLSFNKQFVEDLFNGKT